MIEFFTGNVLEADAEALVNTVNCVGVMGRGVALQFKRAYPENFKAYEKACKHGEVQPGKMFVYSTGRMTAPRYIINFPTKRHWKANSRMEDIEAGLVDLVKVIRSTPIRSIALPPLGAGLGGLQWDAVKIRIEQALSDIPNLKVIVFEPHSTPVTVARTTAVPEMTPGRAAIVGLLDRYLRGLLDPQVSLLELHKLMYLLQEAGQPLKFRFVKALYGPYAENLRQPLLRIEGHLISGYNDGGDDPKKILELVPGAATDAERFLEEHPTTRRRFDRVVDLVQGFESAFGLELLATVHWLATHDHVASAPEAIEATYRWNPRKRRFSPEQIELAWATLEGKGWLPGSSASDSPDN